MCLIFYQCINIIELSEKGEHTTDNTCAFCIGSLNSSILWTEGQAKDGREQASWWLMLKIKVQFYINMKSRRRKTLNFIAVCECVRGSYRNVGAPISFEESGCLPWANVTVRYLKRASFSMTLISTIRSQYHTIFTFGIISAMNFCPPNPGSTVMISTISTRSTNGSTDSTGVFGFTPTPTFIPAFFICWISSRGLSDWSKINEPNTYTLLCSSRLKRNIYPPILSTNCK